MNRTQNFIVQRVSTSTTDISIFSGNFVRSFTLRRVKLVLLLDDRRRLRDVLAEDLGLDEPGQPDGEFVADKFLGGDVEDLCICVLVYENHEGICCDKRAEEATYGQVPRG